MELSLGDIEQQYSSSLVLYKGDPVFIMPVVSRTIGIYFLEAEKTEYINFDSDLFKPISRLGLVNVCCTAVYITRMPIRKYQIGLNSENALIENIPTLCPAIGENGKRKIQTLRDKNLVNTIRGIYPSFIEAFELAKINKGTWAFDRQFAIDCEGKIVYKNKLVGVANQKATSPKEIVFDKHFAYLPSILGDK